jgi:hypothetical protein
MATEGPVQPAGPARRRPLTAGLLTLGLLALLGAWLLARVPGGSAGEKKKGASRPRTLPELFPRWPRPDLALVLSGQQHGYLQPCGCSEPQYGGLTRRYNFLQLLKAGGWPVTALDLGDIPQRSGLQTMLKYTTSMEALKKMGYTAVALGEYEMNMPLLDALANYALNNPSPRALAANLRNKDKGQEFDGMVHSWKVTGGKGQVKVGVVASVGPSVAKRVKDPDVAFDAGPKVLPKMLQQMRAEKPELLVLLYQGSVTEAKACAKAVPNFHVILCVAEEKEPPSVPETVGNTWIITLGHKTRYVGVVGVNRTGKANKPFDLRYQLVALGDEFNTPERKEKNHPLEELMQGYARTVKEKKFLAQAARRQVPHLVQTEFPKATYVGDATVCKKCHKSAYEIWKDSPHSHAYKTLVEAKNPSLRQYDPECIGCHVTGWGYKGGFTDEVKTKLLKDNGCENCHGPCSEHVAAEGAKKADLKLQRRLRDLINPYRYDPDETAKARKKRINQIDFSCQQCHDQENDVHWKIDKWWDGKIVHSGDPKKPE